MNLFYRSLWLLLAGIVFFLLAGLLASWAPDKPVDQLAARWAQPPSRFLTIDAMQVHLRDEGPRDDPVPIVLIHGTSDSLHTWDAWAQVLQRQRRVVRFDLPGFGLTGPAPDDDYSMARYVRFVAATLDHLGIQRCVLAGNSLGGQIAWEAALAMPRRVQQLVLVDAGGYDLAPQQSPLAFDVARVKGLRQAMEYLLPRGLVQSGLRQVYGNPSKVTPELVDRYYDMALRAGNRRALGIHAHVGLGGEAARISQLRQPALVIWGMQDRLIPVQAGRQFARDIAGSRLVLLDGVGHLPQQEDPGRSVAAVLDFLGLKPVD